MKFGATDSISIKKKIERSAKRIKKGKFHVCLDGVLLGGFQEEWKATRFAGLVPGSVVSGKPKK